MTIPRLKTRLDAMVFRRRFDLQVAEILPDLGLLRSAVLDLRNSKRFKSVLQAVLVLGNALNASTFRGNAAGFQLDALLKVTSLIPNLALTLTRQMKETRTAKGSSCPTLLHYLAKILLQADARLILLGEDMLSLEGASRRKR